MDAKVLTLVRPKWPGRCPGHCDPWAYSGADLAGSGLSRSSVWVFWTCFPWVLRKGASGSLVFCLVWKPSSFWRGLSELLGQVLAPGSSQRRTAASGAGAPESWQEGWPHTCLVGQSPSPGPLPQASLSYFSSYLCLVLNILPPNYSRCWGSLWSFILIKTIKFIWTLVWESKE